MKVLNYTTSYFAVILLILIPLWAGIFYYAMLDEIYDSIDDGLDNQKGLIIQKAAVDSSILRKTSFEEGDYSIKEISFEEAKDFHDVYVDTMMYMQNEEDFEPVRKLTTIFNHNGKYYHMQVVTSMVEEDDLRTALLFSLLWLYLGMVATILIVNNFLLRRIWKPFYKLLRQLRDFKLEEPKPIGIQNTRIDEFRLLNETLGKLLQGNIDSYKSQKHFIENASHELQTPLAISINKIEALAESDRLSPHELKLIASALDNLERLTRLNKSLLLLFRIENKQFLVEQEINFNKLIHKIADDFVDQLNYNQVTINIVENGTLTVKMNADLATILITNLLKNAVLHNHKTGFINITINNENFVIENSSPNTKLDERIIFNRFNKEKQSDHSIGLGLSIVKGILDYYSFHILYKFESRHIFMVSFK